MRHRHPPSSGPVLYNHSGIVLSDIQQIVLRNLDFFHLRVPSCTVTATACVHGGEEEKSMALPTPGSSGPARHTFKQQIIHFDDPIGSGQCMLTVPSAASSHAG